MILESQTNYPLNDTDITITYKLKRKPGKTRPVDRPARGRGGEPERGAGGPPRAERPSPTTPPASPLIKVSVRSNESLEAALRRFKRQCNYSGIFRLAKANTWHEKRSDRRRRERHFR